jgi:hypothetical protein
MDFMFFSMKKTKWGAALDRLETAGKYKHLRPVEIQRIGCLPGLRQVLPPFLKEDRGGFWADARCPPPKISLNPSLEKREAHRGDLDISHDIEFQTLALARLSEHFPPGRRIKWRSPSQPA